MSFTNRLGALNQPLISEVHGEASNGEAYTRNFRNHLARVENRSDAHPFDTIPIYDQIILGLPNSVIMSNFLNNGPFNQPATFR